jgi:hypothetical protein
MERNANVLLCWCLHSLQELREIEGLAPFCGAWCPSGLNRAIAWTC